MSTVIAPMNADDSMTVLNMKKFGACVCFTPGYFYQWPIFKPILESIDQKKEIATWGDHQETG